MKRESGWYWVKLTIERDYVIRYYNANIEMWQTSSGCEVHDDYYEVINETRIKSPEEK